MMMAGLVGYDGSLPRRLELTVPTGDDAARLDGMLKAVRALCPGWTEGTAAQVKVLQGGITNQLYLLWPEGKCAETDGVLVRLYGKNTEVLIDRAEESLVFHVLAEKGFGPRLYGLFENGRVEGFVPSKGVEPSEMGQRAPVDYVKLISQELARMHYLDMPLPREPHLWSFLAKFSALTAKIALPEHAEDQARLDALRLPALRERLAQLEDELPSARNDNGAKLMEAASGEPERAAMRFLFESVFAHNDLLAGNVLFVENESRMQIIDFEYGKYNFRGFDIANHFCEYAGFDFDLARWYPAPEAQRAFLTLYLEACAAQGAPGKAELLRRVREDSAFGGAFLSACVSWLDKFAEASHFLWGLWALIQRVHSVIDFDYLDYARLRLMAISV